MKFLLCTCAALLLASGAAADQSQDTRNDNGQNTETNNPAVVNDQTATMSDDAQAETWPINLHRPVQIGYTARMRAEGSEHRSITGVVDGVSQKFHEHEMSVNFDADATVSAIDAVGRPITMDYTVRTATMSMNGQSYVIAAAETVITATRTNEGTKFEIDGEPLDENAAAALDIVASLPQAGPTVENVFGTANRQPVGGEWPVNVEAAMEAFNADVQPEVSAGDISGRSTLLAVKQKNDQECLMISSRVTLQNTIPGIDKLPSGFNVHRAFTTVMKQMMLPVDHDFQPVQDSMNMDLEAVLIGSLGPDQPETVLHLSGTRAAARTFEVIERGRAVSSIFE